MPEAMDAAVAPVARFGLVAHTRGGPWVGEVDLRRDRGDETVREPGRAPGLVGLRQVGHQVREGDAVVAGVLPADGVHEPVAVAQQPAAGSVYAATAISSSAGPGSSVSRMSAAKASA